MSFTIKETNRKKKGRNKKVSYLNLVNKKNCFLLSLNIVVVYQTFSRVLRPT